MSVGKILFDALAEASSGPNFKGRNDHLKDIGGSILEELNEAKDQEPAKWSPVFVLVYATLRPGSTHVTRLQVEQLNEIAASIKAKITAATVPPANPLRTRIASAIASIDI
jgi:hypothetical protein